MVTVKNVINMETLEMFTIFVIVFMMVLITFLAYNVDKYNRVRVIFYAIMFSLFISLMAVLSLTGSL